MNSIIKNPFLRNLEIVESFLKEERDIFLNKAKKVAKECLNSNYEELKKRNFIYKEGDFFRHMIEGLPSFDKTWNMVDSQPLTDFSNEVEGYV